MNKLKNSFLQPFKKKSVTKKETKTEKEKDRKTERKKHGPEEKEERETKKNVTNLDVSKLYTQILHYEQFSDARKNKIYCKSSHLKESKYYEQFSDARRNKKVKILFVLEKKNFTQLRSFFFLLTIFKCNQRRISKN